MALGFPYKEIPSSWVPSPEHLEPALSCSDSLNQLLARFEEGNLLLWHVDAGSGFWIASDSCSSLARMKGPETADFNLVGGSQGADDAVKYMAQTTTWDSLWGSSMA
jgi:hypothetical protein